MNSDFVIAFKSGVVCYPDGDDILISDERESRLRWKTPSAGWRAVLTRLSNAGADIDELALLLSELDGSTDWALLHYRLQTLADKALLNWSVVVQSLTWLTLHPMTKHYRCNERLFLAADARYRLSRFVTLRCEAKRWLLETPLSHAKLYIFTVQAMMLLQRLAEPTSLAELTTIIPETQADKIAKLLLLLSAANAVDCCDAEGKLAEDHDPVLTQWEAQDLLFHSRSRKGRHDYAFGATYRFLDKIDPLPAIKPASNNTTTIIQLPIPDLERLQREDPPFAAVVEARKSVRTYAQRQLSLTILGEFLYRTAHIKAQHEIDRSQRVFYPLAMRPYPNGGAAYELEFYLSVRACEGLEPGLYRYEPASHTLLAIAGFTDAVKKLLENARQAANAPEPPPLLITITARFQRVSWKYQAISYAIILKNVGVVYHQLYLAATVMGLAPCALGGGDADLFAEAAGLDYYQETSVGEFMLGGQLQ